MAAHNQQHLIELDGNKPVDILLAVSTFAYAMVTCKIKLF